MPFTKGHKGFRNKESYENPVTRRKISLANTGRILSDETKKKISKNNARIWLGKKRPAHTAEARKKISDALSGKPSWNKGVLGFRAGEKHHWYGRDVSREKSPSWKGGPAFWKKDDRR